MCILETGARELLIRVCIGIVVASLYWLKFPHMPVAAIPNFITTLTSIFATLLGFIITAIALLASLLDKPLIKNMQRTGHYKRLMTDAFITCFTLLILVIAGLTCLMVKSEYQEVCISLLIGITVISTLYIFETGKRFFRVIRAIS